MDIQRHRLIEKVKRCLALSQSANDTESATALRQAHVLMQKHNISLHELHLSDITQTQSETQVAKKPPTYLIALCKMIANLFGCEIYLTPTPSRASICFVGLDTHSEIAAYAYDSLSRQLKQARNQYLKAQLSRVRLPKNKTARADAFCLGWVATVKQLTQHLVPVATDRQLIEQFMRQELALVKASTTDRTKSVASQSAINDYYNGRQAGNDARLHHAMHSTSTTNTLLGDFT